MLYFTLGDNRVWMTRLVRRVPFLRQLLNKVSWYDTHAMRSDAGWDSPPPVDTHLG
jgi:hypothetical protein